VDEGSASTPPAAPQERRSTSRAPLYVVLGFFAIAVTLVLIGAMRSSEKSSPAPVVQPGTVASPRPITVIMRDYLFEPNPLALVPGETIRLTAFDAGLEPHELVLGDQTVQDAWSAANAAATLPGPLTTAPPASAPVGTGGLRLLVRSGEQATIDWTVPSVGPLLMQCHLSGHLERGMTAGVVLAQIGPSSSPRR
jgi:uncharacterized cupredoxin-like copper-binding protein